MGEHLKLRSGDGGPWQECLNAFLALLAGGQGRAQGSSKKAEWQEGLAGGLFGVGECTGGKSAYSV